MNTVRLLRLYDHLFVLKCINFNLVVPSGSGKTAAVIDLAIKHFVVYCVCCSPSAFVSPDFEDSNFVRLAKDVEFIYLNRTDRKPRTLPDLLDFDSSVKVLAGERVELEFLARLLFLQLLLNNNPDLEPQRFFREQTTTGGAETICELVNKLRKYDRVIIRTMFTEVQIKLHSLLRPKGIGLVIALDEVQVAENSILADKLIAPSALIRDKNILIDSKNQIQSRFRRGFLMPLSATLSKMRATLVILGTSLSLQNADDVYSAIDKPNNFTKITDFPVLDECEVIKVISDLVDMSDCEIPPAKRLKLSGRPRFSIGVVNRLVATGSTQDSKQATLNNAIDDTIKHVKSGLRGGVRAILEGKDPVFSEYLDQLDRIVAGFGKVSTVKGDVIEPLVRRTLQRFNGFRIVDLPFLQGIALPRWCDDMLLQIDINTAIGFGYDGSSTHADLDFLTDCPPNKMLVATSGARPDGAWFFSDKRYAGSLAIKFYSNAVLQKDHKENETSSDIRCFFLKADGITANSSLEGIRRTFETSGIPSNIKGILRIHLEFPHVSGSRPVTHIRKDPATGAEDVMVYINISNMDTFFDEGVAEHRDEMVILKRLIKLVSARE
ncbi:hypothetical protein EDD21DRAFT_413488 [Dissophora ornata]|nr:hypothetical protein BGZ58_003931 [Dissophora ornata]KAI8602962.1 hypothetical protein EDD21DRAFT_413488 [Dissophora ornata]